MPASGQFAIGLVMFGAFLVSFAGLGLLLGLGYAAVGPRTVALALVGLACLVRGIVLWRRQGRRATEA